MKFILAAAALLVMFTGTQAMGTVWADPIDTFAAADPSMDSDQGRTEEPPYTDGDLDIILPGSQVPVNWYHSNSDWNDAKYDVEKVGSAAKYTPNEVATGFTEHVDVFPGRRIDGLTPGQLYTVSFDVRLDPGLIAAANPGQYRGDRGDHVPQFNAMVRNALETVGEEMARGLLSGDGIVDAEDYVGHERENTLWVGDPADWDGTWHTYSIDFTPREGNPFEGSVALIFKMRSWNRDQGSGAGFWIDNIVVTPEPASLGLMALGGLLLRRRKNR